MSQAPRTQPAGRGSRARLPRKEPLRRRAPLRGVLPFRGREPEDVLQLRKVRGLLRQDALRRLRRGIRPQERDPAQAERGRLRQVHPLRHLRLLQVRDSQGHRGPPQERLQPARLRHLREVRGLQAAVHLQQYLPVALRPRHLDQQERGFRLPVRG